MMLRDGSQTQICCAQYLVGNTCVHAVLHAYPDGLGVRYVIVLEQKDQTETCDVGRDAQMARELFMRVVFGGVSACTLADVAEDYLGTHFS